jgi:D-lactate dehydrogenase
MPNVLITSHQAFLTREALANIAQTTVDNIIKFFNNELNSDDEVCYRCGNQANCAKKRNAKCF